MWDNNGRLGADKNRTPRIRLLAKECPWVSPIPLLLLGLQGSS